MFGFKEHLKQDALIDKTKLIYLPLTIMLMSIAFMFVIGFFYNRAILLNQLETDGLVLAEQTVVYIDKYLENKETIINNMEDKLAIAGRLALDHKDEINNTFLKKIADNFGIADIYYYTPTGEIIYSATGEYIGWKATPGDPIHSFMTRNSNVFHEDIRKSTETDDYYKFSYFQDQQGNFIQLGLMAGDVIAKTNKYDFQQIITDIAQDGDIMYTLLVDKNLISIASSDKSNIALDYSQVYEFQQALNGHSTAKEKNYEKLEKKVLEVSVPLIIDGNVEGVLVIGQSLASIENINRITFLTLLILSGLISTFVLLFQRKYVIYPMIRLGSDIQKLDVEKNIDFHLPVSVDNPFKGIYNVINQILSKIHEHIFRIKDLHMKLGMVVENTGVFVYEIDINERTIVFPFGFDSSVLSLKENKICLFDFLNKYIEEKEIKKIGEAYRRYLDGEADKIQFQTHIKDINGKTRYYLFIAIKQDNTPLILGNVIDVTRLMEQELHMEYMAYHDVLTSLPNRRLLMDNLEETLNNHQTGALFLIDLDDMKDINDTLGHLYGDQVLKIISQRLMHVKQNNFLSRFGGDEFVMIIYGHQEIIDKSCRDIMNITRMPIKIDEHELTVNCSLGIAMFPQDGIEASELIAMADVAMYNAKKNFKNDYAYFEPNMLESIKESNRIYNILRQAIHNKGFKLVYQPIVDAKTCRTVGFEALLRLTNHNISPDRFIKIAEEKGLIIEIGRWVVGQVIRQLSEWRQKGLDIKPVAVNLSPGQIRDEGFIEYLEELFVQHAIEPECLEIEITENVFVENNEKTIVFLQKIRRMGIRISLDDFGSGYSSLNYLTFMPVDKIKLDKSINDKYLNADNYKIIKHIISLSHDLKLKIVAEGIEVKEQLEILQDIECDFIQGYYFSKPVEAKKAEIML